MVRDLSSDMGTDMGSEMLRATVLEGGMCGL